LVRFCGFNDGNNNTATYSYLANSALVGHIAFATNGVARMTTAKTYDYLNRLTGISSQPGAAGLLPLAYSYAYNAANQRRKDTLADGSHWVYGNDSLEQVSVLTFQTVPIALRAKQIGNRAPAPHGKMFGDPFEAHGSFRSDPNT
jgi:hypothetical protein